MFLLDWFRGLGCDRELRRKELLRVAIEKDDGNGVVKHIKSEELGEVLIEAVQHNSTSVLVTLCDVYGGGIITFDLILLVAYSEANSLTDLLITLTTNEVNYLKIMLFAIITENEDLKAIIKRHQDNDKEEIKNES